MPRPMKIDDEAVLSEKKRLGRNVKDYMNQMQERDLRDKKC